MDITDMCVCAYSAPRKFYIADYTLFSNIHIKLSRTDYIIVHKINHRKVKKLEIYQGTCDHSGMELEINNRKKTKVPNTWKLHNTLLKNHYIKRNSTGNLKNIREQTKVKIQLSKTFRMQQRR